MCGLCGLAGPEITNGDLDAMKELLVVTGLRGPHSTGLFTYTPTGAYHKEPYRLHKAVQNSHTFISADDRKKHEDKMFRSIFTELYMGHCRYATVGAINPENAHPFDTGRYVSAHNGTLNDAKYWHKDKTDSQMMFEEMEKSGVKETLEALSPSSAFAISMFDRKTNSLILARNSKRPLFFGIHKTRDVIFYASEERALQFIQKWYERDKVELDLFEVVAGSMLTFKLKDIKAGKETYDYQDLKLKTYGTGKGTKYADEEYMNWWAKWEIEDSVDKSRTQVPANVSQVNTRGETIDYVGGYIHCSTCGEIMAPGLDMAGAQIHHHPDGSAHYTCVYCVDQFNKLNGKVEKKVV